MLAVSATANISFNIKGSPDAANLELATALAQISLSRGVTMAHGTAADKVNNFYAGILDITGGSNATIDLQPTNGDSVLNPFGVTLDIDFLKMLYLKNLSDAAMIVGPEAQGIAITGDPTAHTILLPVGAEILHIYGGEGITVEAADKDLFISAAGAGTKECEVIIVGVKSA